MVLFVHCSEPFYLGGPQGTYIATHHDAVWLTIIDSFCRSAVPLFLLASSYLLFPLKTDTKSFFKRRVVRVLIPLALWMVIYACLPMDILSPLFGGEKSASFDVAANFKTLIVNFVPQAGHLWFVYMLMGIYLLMPLLSPWAEKVSKRAEQAFLALWLFTTMVPFIRWGARALAGSPDLWGVCPWNEFGALHYVSGFIGYLVLGHYLRTYVGELSWRKTLAWAIPLWVVGYAIVLGGVWVFLPSEFPLDVPYQFAVDMETSWGFCSTGVALTTLAYFLIIRKFCSSGWFYRKVVFPISKRSYGIYLMHMFVLTPIIFWVRSWGLSTALTIPIAAVLTYAGCALLSWMLSLLPKSKYLIG